MEERRKENKLPFSFNTYSNKYPKPKSESFIPLLIKHHACAPAGFNGSAPPFLSGKRCQMVEISSLHGGFVRYKV